MESRHTSPMSSVVTTTSGFTIEDLEGLPSDGNRYELIEGSLHVTPVPGFAHQRAIGNLFHVLRQACPPELEVVLGPFDVQLGPDTMVEPDVLVTRPDDPTEKRLEQPPLLAIEVLSPSTRLYDLGTKRLAYEQFGVPAYWVVDVLDPGAARITEWRWAASGVAEPTERTVEGDAAFTAEYPFPVTVVPARLPLLGG